jgi:hypothetical protein
MQYYWGNKGMRSNKPRVPSDIVFSTIPGILEDFVYMSDDIVHGSIDYNTVAMAMVNTLIKMRSNLRVYIMNKKWTNREERITCQDKIREINAIIRACRSLAKSTDKLMDSIIKIMSALESTPGLDSVIEGIEYEEFPDETNPEDT